MPLYRDTSITGFSTSLNTSSPNATVNVARLLTNTTSTNGDIVISPKGSGSILGQLPNSLASGGDKRGTYSVDLQLSRNNADRVCSGDYSTIGGGQDNLNSSYLSVISGGYNNQSITGLYSNILAGANNIIYSGNNCNILSGATNTINTGVSNATIIGGSLNTINQSGSIVCGAGGISNRQNEFVFANGNSLATGDLQLSTLIIYGITTTSEVLTSGGGDASTNNQIQLQNNQSVKVNCDVLIRSTSAGLTKNIEIVAVIKRGANAASTTVSTPIYTTIFEDSGSESWTVVLDADTTNGAGRITVTSASSVEIKAVAKVEILELMT